LDFTGDEVVEEFEGVLEFFAVELISDLEGELEFC
jgi:hypothetical protein